MSKELNASCAICKKKYHVCNSCKSTKKIKPWRTITDTIDCYKIYMIIYNYKNKSISKDDAKKQLEECTMPDTFQDHIKKVIDEIMGTDKKNKIEIKKGSKNNLDNNE